MKKNKAESKDTDRMKSSEAKPLSADELRTGEKQKDKQQKRLAWVLREWDCRTLQDAMKQAATDAQLHRILRECGIIFPKKGV
jgi:hypothetical protein